MLFAINYSPQAAHLVQDSSIPLDRFKCPDWPDLIREAQAILPVYVHFDLKAGSAVNTPVDWSRVLALRTLTKTPYINLHLSPMPADFPDIPVETTDPAHVTRITDRMIEDVMSAINLVGVDSVIVENIPLTSKFRVMRPSVMPAVIRQVVNETGCGFLLDVSHARLAARQLGMDEFDYLAQMPCERLCELHITGIAPDSSGEDSDHMALTVKDWPYVEWVLDRVRCGDWGQPWIAALEYGGIGPHFEWRSETEVIREQVPRLYELVHRED